MRWSAIRIEPYRPRALGGCLRHKNFDLADRLEFCQSDTHGRSADIQRHESCPLSLEAELQRFSALRELLEATGHVELLLWVEGQRLVDGLFLDGCWTQKVLHVGGID